MSVYPINNSDELYELLMTYWNKCHDERMAWQERDDDQGRSELWLSRAMGISWVMGEIEDEN